MSWTGDEQFVAWVSRLWKLLYGILDMTEQHRCYPSTTHWKFTMIEPTNMQCHTKWENMMNIPDCSLPKGNCLQKISCDRKDRKGCPKSIFYHILFIPLLMINPPAHWHGKSFIYGSISLGFATSILVYLTEEQHEQAQLMFSSCGMGAQQAVHRRHRCGKNAVSQCVNDWRPIWHPGICLSGVYWGRLDIKMQPPNLPKSKASHSWR